MNGRIQHYLFGLAVVLGLMLFSPAPIMAQSTKGQQPMQCNVGPATRTYANTSWLLYSCEDSRSLVIITAPGNPATPFYFMFSVEQNKYRLVGEGTGSKTITDAVCKELASLSAVDIATLVEETKKH